MRKLISERTLVVVLFFAAFIVFFFAQEETRKQEKLQLELNATVMPTLLPVPQSDAALVTEESSNQSEVLR